MNKKIQILHGHKKHSFADRYDCLFCIDVEIEYLQDLKEAGGWTKLMKEKFRGQ